VEEGLLPWGCYVLRYGGEEGFVAGDGEGEGEMEMVEVEVERNADRGYGTRLAWTRKLGPFSHVLFLGLSPGVTFALSPPSLLLSPFPHPPNLPPPPFQICMILSHTPLYPAPHPPSQRPHPHFPRNLAGAIGRLFLRTETCLAPRREMEEKRRDDGDRWFA